MINTNTIKSTLYKGFLTFKSNTDNHTNIINNINTLQMITTLIQELKDSKNIVLSGNLIYQMMSLNPHDIEIISSALLDTKIAHILNPDYKESQTKNQLLEYFISYNLSINSARFFYEYFNDDEVYDILSAKPNNSVKILDFKPILEYKNEIISILKSSIVFSSNDLELLKSASDNGTLSEILISNIFDFKVKENLFYIISIIEKTLLNKLISTNNIFKTANDVLRYSYYVTLSNLGLKYSSSEDYSLDKEFKFKLKTSDKKTIMNALDSLDLNNALNDIKPKRNEFLKLGINLHPAQKSFKKYKRAQEIFNNLRNLNFSTFNTKVNSLIKSRSTLELTKLLSKKPGELIRRLDFIIRNSKKDFSEILNIIQDTHFSPKLILSIIPRLKYRIITDLDTRYFNLKTKVVKIEGKPLTRLNDKKTKKVIKALKNKLKEHLKNKELNLKD